MAFDVSRRRELLSLAGDGCLITAGTFALMMGAAFVLEWLGVVPLGEPRGSGISLVLSFLSWLLQVGSFVVGPLLAWRLHGRRFGKADVPGLIVGFPVGGALVMPLAILGPLIDWFVGLFSPAKYAGAIGYLAFVVFAFLAVLVLVDVDALRDLSMTRRSHLPLDVGRLMATVAVVAFASVGAAKMIAGEGALEASVFLLLAAIQGASVVVVADVVAGLIAKRAHTREATG